MAPTGPGRKVQIRSKESATGASSRRGAYYVICQWKGCPADALQPTTNTRSLGEQREVEDVACYVVDCFGGFGEVLEAFQEFVESHGVTTDNLS